MTEVMPSAPLEVSIRVELLGSLPYIEADRGRLSQILENLLRNAINYCKRGYITCSAQYIQEDDSFKVCISDTGSGIPPEQLDSIFLEFQEQTTAFGSKHGGSGMSKRLFKNYCVCPPL